MTNDRPQALYRFYADDGTLLYVGITLDPGARWRAHQSDKPWWQQVTTITIETHPDRDSVSDAERAAIIAEGPRYNIVHNTPANCHLQDVTDELDDLLLAVAGSAPDTGPWGTSAEHMPDQCQVCRPSGIYLPYLWRKGLAWYRCTAGHMWRCSWGHDHDGMARQNAGQQVDT